MADTYCAVPVDRVTDEMVAASTAGHRANVAVTPDGRAILRYRGDVPAAAARFVTRDGAGMQAWVASRPVPTDPEAAVEAHRATLRGRG